MLNHALRKSLCYYINSLLVRRVQHLLDFRLCHQLRWVPWVQYHQGIPFDQVGPWVLEHRSYQQDHDLLSHPVRGEWEGEERIGKGGEGEGTQSITFAYNDTICDSCIQ